jgi:hypothetical protein
MYEANPDLYPEMRKFFFGFGGVDRGETGFETSGLIGGSPIKQNDIGKAETY